MTLAALVTGQPFVFPSLGPTAYALFDRPRTVLFGHLVGVVAGYVSLGVFGLRNGPSTLHGRLGPDRIGATALALGLTAAGMVVLGYWHAPAGATTLIVSLGLLTRPTQLGVLMGGVVLLIMQGIVLDKLALPTWRPQAVRLKRREQPGVRRGRRRTSRDPDSDRTGRTGQTLSAAPPPGRPG